MVSSSVNIYKRVHALKCARSLQIGRLREDNFVCSAEEVA